MSAVTRVLLFAAGIVFTLTCCVALLLRWSPVFDGLSLLTLISMCLTALVVPREEEDAS